MKLTEYKIIKNELSDCCQSDVEICGHTTKFFRCKNCGNTCDTITKYKAKVEKLENSYGKAFGD